MTPRTARFLAGWSLVALTFPGCAAVRAVGGSRVNDWRELTSPHFVLRTDLAAADAAAASAALETTRDVLLAAAWPKARPDDLERTEVYVLADSLEFQRYFGRLAGGFFARGVTPAFFLFGRAERWEVRDATQVETTSILLHELTHQLAASFFARQPRWFSEGLAQFMETVHLSADRRAVLMGAPHLEAWRGYREIRSVSLQDALTWDGLLDGVDDTRVSGLYATSWLLVHWLFNTQGEAFARYQTELVRGTEPGRAWTIAFPGFDVAARERDLYAYSQHGNYAELSAPVQIGKRRIDERRLGLSDIHAIRARLALVASRMRHDGRAFADEARREVEAALQFDDANIQALAVDQWTDPAQHLIRLRRGTAAHPDDPLGWILFAGEACKLAPGECEPAWRRAVALAPKSPPALNGLAWTLLERGRPSEALPLVIRAVARAPWHWGAIDTYAAALFALGSCRHAVAAERRALDQVSDQERTREDVAVLRQSLAKYQASCPEAAADGNRVEGNSR